MKKGIILTLTFIALNLCNSFAQQNGNLEDIVRKYNIPMPNLKKNNTVSASERSGAILVDSTKLYIFDNPTDSFFTKKTVTYRKTKNNYVTFLYKSGGEKLFEKDTVYNEIGKNHYYGYFVEGLTGKLDKPWNEIFYYYNDKVKNNDSLLFKSESTKGVYSPWLKLYYKYNSKGKLIKDSFLIRDFDTGLLKPSGVHEYTYEINGRIATSSNFSFSSGYHLESIDTYSYPNALTQQTISVTYPLGTPALKTISIYSNTDFQLENRISYKRYQFDATKGNYVLADSTRVEFDINKNPILEDKWDGATLSKYLRKFNNSNQILVDSYFEKEATSTSFKLNRRTYGFFSAGVSTKENRELEAKTNIYPNPTTSSVFVEASEDALITIFDLNGRILLTQQAANQWINVANLPKGVYLMKITSKDGALAVKKFVKE